MDFFNRYIFDVKLKSAWFRVLRLWKPMAAWTLFIWIAVALIASPVTSAVLGIELFRGDRLVIGNEALIDWILSPTGLTYLFLAGALTISGAVIHFGGLFQIISNDLMGRTQSLKNTILHITPRIPLLFKLCVFTIFAVFLLMIPLIAGFALIYLLLLADYDINYYLSQQPVEWYYALTAGTLWLLIWCIGILWIAGRSLLGLPAYLYGNRTIRESLKRAWSLSRDKSWRLLKLISISISLWIIIRAFIDALLIFIASGTISWTESMFSSLQPLILMTGSFLAMTLFTDAVVSFFGFSFVSTILTKFYYEESGFQTRITAGPGIRNLTSKTVSRLSALLKPTRFLTFMAVLLALSMGFSAYMLAHLPELQDVKISAHRAGPPPAPENTLAALERAIDSGADYSEIDVQRTRDGTLVIVHDEDLMRVAGDPRRIAHSDFEELKDLVQRPDDGTPPEERQLATLNEFLERAKGRIDLMVELKYYGSDPQLAVETVRTIREHGMEDETVLMSLKYDAVQQLITLATDIPVGYLSAISVGDITRLPVEFLAISRGGVNPGLIRSANSQNIEIHVWTINRASVMADLIEMGVDGIITDDPELAIRVREEMNSLTLAERLLLQFRKFIVYDPPGDEESPVAF